MDPENIDALAAKGWSLYSLGNYKEAIEYHDKVLAIDPYNVDAKNKKDYIQALNKGNFTQ